MSRVPGAIWRPLNPLFLPNKRMACYNRANFHVTAGRGSPYNTFNRAGAASSHGFVYKTGVIEQYVDTDFQAEADVDGNDATLSWETEGGYPNSIAQSEPWTPEQVESLARIFAFCVRQHGIVDRLATSSKIGAESKGLSWHRLGVDGNFPALPSILAGRRQRGGGMLYSKSFGKVCPGDAKILQIPGILVRAQVLLGVTPAVNPLQPPAPAPVPTPFESSTQALSMKDEDMGRIIEAFYRTRLNRQASAAEVDSWIMVAVVNNWSITQMYANFMQSHAEQGTVVAAYREFLKRVPNQAEITTWSDTETIMQVWAGVGGSDEAKSKR